MLKNMSHLNQRLAVGLLVSCLILVAIYFSSYPYFRPLFALMAASVIGAAVWEFYQMSKKLGFRPLETLGVLGSVVYMIAAFWSTQTHAAALLPGIVCAILFLFAFLHFFFLEGHALSDLAVTVFGFIYLTIPLSFLININYYNSPEMPLDGRWWLVFLVLITKMADVGGFFFGKMCGRIKLAPFISPKKTWEGFIGGIFMALAAAYAYHFFSEYLFAPVDFLPLGILLFLAAIIACFGQLGDLSESILKRDAGVKDSNHLPGLGGALDMLDSLVFTTPIVYIFLRLMYA